MVEATEVKCPSCGSPWSGPFCASCGERRQRAGDLTVRAFLGDLLAALTNLDGKFLRSLRGLILRPGSLTAARLRGERVPYLGPVQLFLLANLLAIVGGRLLGTSPSVAGGGAWDEPLFADAIERASAARGLDRAAFLDLARSEATSIVRYLFLGLIPLQAAIGFLLHARSRVPSGVHWFLACSFLSFYCLVPDLVLGFAHEATLDALRSPAVDRIGTVTRLAVPWLACTAWLAGAERRVFDLQRGAAWGRAALGAALFLLLSRTLFQVLVTAITLARLA